MSSVNSSFPRFPHKKGLKLLYNVLIRKTINIMQKNIQLIGGEVKNEGDEQTLRRELSEKLRVIFN